MSWIRLVNYQLLQFSRSYRYFTPMALYLIVLIWIYSIIPNPVMSSYAATAIILYLISSWLGLNFYFVEPEVQQQLTIMHARSSIHYYWSRMLTAWITTIPLSLAAVYFPMIRGAFKRHVSIGESLFVLYGHLILALLGVVLAAFLYEWFGNRFISTIGGLLLLLTLSVCSSVIGEALPAWLRPLAWLLPPAGFVMERWNTVDTAVEGAGPLLWSTLYTLVAMAGTASFMRWHRK